VDVGDDVRAEALAPDNRAGAPPERRRHTVSVAR
jgi:hypothetical protein